MSFYCTKTRSSLFIAQSPAGKTTFNRLMFAVNLKHQHLKPACSNWTSTLNVTTRCRPLSESVAATHHPAELCSSKDYQQTQTSAK